LLISASLLTWQRRRFLQLAFDRVAAHEQLGDVLATNLGLEVRIRDRLRTRKAVLQRKNAEEDKVTDESRGEDAPPPPWRRRLSLGQPLSTPGFLRWMRRRR
jgi:hypothetical protein